MLDRKELEERVKELAIAVEPGTALREICPKCGGGGSKEKSLAISIDEQGYLLWFCHRASCDFKGKRSAWGAVGYTPRKPKSVYTGYTELLSSEQEEWLNAKFSLTKETCNNLGFRNNVRDGRIYVPVKDRGCILRAYRGETPKVLTFKENPDLPFMSVYKSEIGQHWPVIVEDCFSAAKVYQAGITAVALHGTHFGVDKLRELLTIADGAILALDKDAFDKAIKYSVQYRPFMKIEVWKLDQDLKYSSEEEIQQRYGTQNTIGSDTRP